jgi:mono/diheme cytochrome c family protein
VTWPGWHLRLACWVTATSLAAACASGTPALSNGTAEKPVPTVTSLPPLPALDPTQVQLGQRVYQTNCATCHGAIAEGALNWATPGPDGLYPAPPHDDRGHTWHHSDRVLYEAIYSGMNDPLRPGSPLRMPAWGGKLTDAEIRAVIEYFKGLWTEEHRLWQWEQTLNDFAPTPVSP